MDADTKTIYEEIKAIAKDRDRGYVNYGEIAPLVGLDMEQPEDRRRIGAILDRINRVEHRAGRRLLSAVVTLKDANIPGTGFFNLAKELRRQPPNEDDLLFWVEEFQRVLSGPHADQRAAYARIRRRVARAQLRHGLKALQRPLCVPRPDLPHPFLAGGRRASGPAGPFGPPRNARPAAACCALLRVSTGI